MLKQTGERLSSKVYRSIMVEHLHRYAFARQYTEGKVVLDIASGEGFGSNLLSKNAAFVYGVDLSADAVEHSRNEYRQVNTKFIEGNATNIPLLDGEVDVVVSFETLEHLTEHEQMIQECRRVMKEDGIFIISTPNKKFYSDLTGYRNEFHVKELYDSEFTELVGKYFSNIVLYRQGIVKGGIIYRADEFDYGLKIYKGDYNEVALDKNIDLPEYLIIVASNRLLKTQNNSFFESAAVDSTLHNEIARYKKMYEVILDSRSYRLGKILLLPLQYIRSFLSRK